MPKEPLKLQAYQIIKDNIINCTYYPGAIINEERIRKDIPASRTPIRDALSRLEQEGLVTILPKKGIIISELTVKDLNMLYESRDLIEPYVLSHYGNRIPLETYLNYYCMYQDYLNGTITEYSYIDMDDNFHQTLLNAAENSYFRNMYSTIESQIQRTRIITGMPSHERLVETVNEHLAIADAALKNDWDAAAKAMKYHLNMSKNACFNYLLHNKN